LLSFNTGQHNRELALKLCFLLSESGTEHIDNTGISVAAYIDGRAEVD
jgi:hypothetical protein